MKLMQWRSDLVVAGTNARLRRMLSVSDKGPTPLFRLRAALYSRLLAMRTALSRRRLPAPSAPPSRIRLPKVVYLPLHELELAVTSDPQPSLSGLTCCDILPKKVERWICDEEGSA